MDAMKEMVEDKVRNDIKKSSKWWGAALNWRLKQLIKNYEDSARIAILIIRPSKQDRNTQSKDWRMS